MAYSFSGYRNNKGEAIVLVCDVGGYFANLPKYLNEINHSPDGFNWGYCGSGPAQLAYALLRFFAEQELFGKEEIKEDENLVKNIARTYYQDFKVDVVSTLPDKWVLKGKDIEKWLVAKIMERDNELIS